MALEIVWTKRVQTGYAKIIEVLSQYLKCLRVLRNKSMFTRGPINKHTVLTYRIKLRKKQIELINIRSSRLKPLK